MATCPSCGVAVDEVPGTCSACGTAIPADPDSSLTPTGTAPRPAAPAKASGPRPTSGAGVARLSSTVPSQGRFVPGTLLADRYRIVGLLGKGGMGEVYRADDLRLGLPVALKFLPEALQHDQERLDRFYGEVRVSRQISHPAVVRVHDIGELDGLVFLSMEYVDGEDLASLLRRIGRLPKDKALEIARQICGGVAAAHDKGVLHRDLKPENVMLDGRGKVRITDFGLAAGAESIQGADVRSGTPAYMSPEQLAGREVTVRSDIYALGLVLYELFTGKRAFAGRSFAELLRQHAEQAAPQPSRVVEDIDPAVERVILRCLEKDPRQRPASAIAVVAALPGGDPLAAAIAAGETPSPEMVAAAGQGQVCPHAWAWASLAAALLALGLWPLLLRPFSLFQLVPFDKPPAVLEDRARELIGRLGHAQPPADSAVGFAVDIDYLKSVGTRDRSPRRWDVLRSGDPPAVWFWYRQSPRPLVSQRGSGAVWLTQPPITTSGMAGVRLDTRGRLIEFYAVPPQVEGEAPAPASPDWGALFAEARLDLASFRPVAPKWTPPFFTETRAAWEGRYAAGAEPLLRVEAGGYRGRPAWFRVLTPWTRPERMQSFALSGTQAAAQSFGLALFLGVVVTAALLAKHNVHHGRGDRVGALRLARYVFVVGLLTWALEAHHVADLQGELGLLSRGLASNLLTALCIWMLYLALEPYVRRRWPHTLISWTRLLGGAIGDPLVGRDLLLGVAAGALMPVIVLLGHHVGRWLGQPAPEPNWWVDLDGLLSLPQALARGLEVQPLALGIGMGLLLLLLVLRLLLRREWLAALVLIAILSIQPLLFSDAPAWLVVPSALLMRALLILLLLRFGLLAGVAAVAVALLGDTLPLTAQLTHWTGGATLVALGLASGLAVHGFRCARGAPQPIRARG